MADPSYDLVTEKTKCMCIASSKVRNLANDAKLALPSHQEARTQAHSMHRSLAVQPTANTPAVAPSNLMPSTLTTATSAYKCSSTIIDLDDDDDDDPNDDPDGDGIETTSDFSRGNTHMFPLVCNH